MHSGGFSARMRRSTLCLGATCLCLALLFTISPVVSAQHYFTYEGGSDSEVPLSLHYSPSDSSLYTGMFNWFKYFDWDGSTYMSSPYVQLSRLSLSGSFSLPVDTDDDFLVGSASTSDNGRTCIYGYPNYLVGYHTTSRSNGVACYDAVGNKLGQRILPFDTILTNERAGTLDSDRAIATADRHVAWFETRCSIDTARYTCRDALAVVYTANHELSELDSFVLEINPADSSRRNESAHYWQPDRIAMAPDGRHLLVGGFYGNRQYMDYSDSNEFRLYTREGELLRVHSYRNTRRSSNNLRNESDPIPLFTDDGYVLSYQLLDSLRDDGSRISRVFQRMVKYTYDRTPGAITTAGGYVWEYFNNTDSLQSHFIRGLAYDARENVVYQYGRAVLPESYDPYVQATYAYLGAVDATTGALRWQRYYDCREPKHFEFIENNTIIREDFQFRDGISAISTSDPNALWLGGSRDYYVDSAYLLPIPPDLNVSAWFARVDRSGCFQGDCGSDGYKLLTVTPTEQAPSIVSLNDTPRLVAYPQPVAAGTNFQVEVTPLYDRRDPPHRPDRIRLFTTAGRMVATHPASELRHRGRQQLVAPTTPGVYLVQYGGASVKVVVQ